LGETVKDVDADWIVANGLCMTNVRFQGRRYGISPAEAPVTQHGEKKNGEDKV
jgi:hypothetical protein